MEKAVGIGTRVVQREKIGWKGGAGMDEKKRKERKKSDEATQEEWNKQPSFFFRNQNFEMPRWTKKNIPIYTV